MDSKLLLVKTVTLLYCESICTKVNGRSDELAQKVISQLRIPEQVVENDLTRNVIVGLRDTVVWMSEQEPQEKFEYASLLQRVRLNAGDDFNVLQAFEDAERYSTLDDETLFEIVQSLHKEIHSALNQWAIKETIHKAHRDLFYSRRSIDLKRYISDLARELEKYSNGWKEEQQGFILGLVDMADKQSLKKHLESANEESIEGGKGLKSGWKAVNRMLGENGMFRRGDFVLIGGLTNCYKSGFAHDLFRHFCLYNDPQPGDENKKPTLLYFSAENHLEDDLIRMYIALKENETGEQVDRRAIDTQEASEFVSDRLQARGWSVSMIRVDPSVFTYKDLFNTVLQFESKGYEIHSIIFDYLALISKEGLNHTGMIGEDKRELMQTVRTFMASRNILFITPHQLSQEANSLKRQGAANFVENVAGKNYWDGSKRIVNEVDLEIIVDVVDVSNKSYLAVGRGKHRTVRVTPRKHRFFHLPFEQAGFVPEDICYSENEERTVYDFSEITSAGDFNWD